MTTATIIVLLLAAGGAIAVRLERYLQILQQEHYEAARLRVWQSLHRRDQFDGVLAGLVMTGIAVQLWGAIDDGVGLVFAAAGAIGIGWLASRVLRRESVKPLVWTPRARRLAGVAAALATLLLAATAIVPVGALRPLAITVVAAATLIEMSWLLQLANWLLRPFQRWETQRFVRAAQQRLADASPLVVGVSGSFGKTTTKGCLAALLSPLGPACPTPASFNSYLGIVRAINEGLLPKHRSFIAELGAYRVGDIAELCELVQPTVGVLASLGPAHLERFGSMEAIAQAEGEVAEALPADGLFVTRADDPLCVAVARDRAQCPTVLVSPEPHPEADLWAEDVQIDHGGTTMTVHRREQDETFQITSPLLGEANVGNVLLAVAVALHLGVTPGQLSRAAKRIEIPAHRLQPIVNAAAGVVVIDDSYNSNPVGAAAALGILGAYPAERRILVTPGMVELGPEEEPENIELGRRAADVVDLALLVGRRGRMVEQGMLEAGFDPTGVLAFDEGPEAHAALQQLTRRGDVILFENDLPDVYV